ncbi:MAG: PIN domain-containing protein [Bosea sp. (in: a-proteobacteria)]|uniref:PIN domain-containing protein n=1 Tax=Bosea sp. (in: a-proteobacteria) TaxID=1871050 RepID=UPI002732DA74|nr:PIN domain-containing protein [Bosea sp. (in: a-proteobacteria)]MDP3256314.1 PIN domain-containing protein [Bosea sp. (in: a-proteobacteria)]MDP3320311.1 PIN domain-containing protein [Bosea sp. (in: a-proteobacteria)]
MIGIDTNILLRAVTNDDPVQSPLARKLLLDFSHQRPGVLNVVTLVEFAWTLRSRYRYRRSEILEIIEQLLRSRAYLVVERSAISEALARSRDEGLDFADALLGELNLAAGCKTTMTFDLKASISTAFSPAP